MERFNSYQNIKAELEKYSDYTPGNLTSDEINKLIYNFKSEQKEKWVAASQKIGELAAKGAHELKSFIEEKLVKKRRSKRIINPTPNHSCLVLSSALCFWKPSSI